MANPLPEPCPRTLEAFRANVWQVDHAAPRDVLRLYGRTALKVAFSSLLLVIFMRNEPFSWI